jgi:hypothetical protein
MRRQSHTESVKDGEEALVVISRSENVEMLGKRCCGRDSDPVPSITQATRVSTGAHYLGRMRESCATTGNFQSSHLPNRENRYVSGFPAANKPEERKQAEAAVSSLFPYRNELGTPYPKLHLTPQTIPQSAHPFSTS